MKTNYNKEIDYLLIFFGFTFFLVIILSFFDRLSFDLSPVCISVAQYNTECILCGMTRGFVAISNLEFANAWHYNRGSFFLYSIFLVIVGFSIASLKNLLNQKKR
jgi:hypothetical protein